jgi:hypothetical protein
VQVGEPVEVQLAEGELSATVTAVKSSGDPGLADDARRSRQGTRR